MANTGITSFNAGELSPKLHGRTDIEKYPSGCKYLENMLPSIYGGAERIPGTLFVYEAKDTPDAVRLFPFIYSSEIAYVVEAGNEYARFYYDGAILLDDVTPVEVVTPYAMADLAHVHYRQLADVMWLCHKSYPQQKLTRTSATAFSLDEITFTKGPFLLRNDILNDDDVTMECDATAAGASGTLTCSADYFEDAHVGALFKLIHAKSAISSSGSASANGTVCAAIDVKGAFRFETSGNWGGTITLQRNENEIGWDNHKPYTSTITSGQGSRNVQQSLIETEYNVQYRAVLSGYSGGSITAEIALDETTLRDGIVRIDSVTDAKNAEVTVIAELESTDATVRWAEGAWSEQRGYPPAVCFFQDRCIYGKGRYLYLSATGDYENFDEGVNDADSFFIPLMTADEICGLEALSDGILVLTSGDPWFVKSNKVGTPITPTSYSAQKAVSKQGNSAIQPVRIENQVVSVNYVRRRIIANEYETDIERGVTNDLSILAEHIGLAGIAGIAYQQNPDSIVWCWLDDGALCSLSYDTSQNLVAWARHPMALSNDTAGSVQSACVIPSAAGEDEVWLAVIRNIGGTNHTYIERMQPRYFENQQDCCFVQCGIEYDDAETDTFDGLDHLEGETVCVLGDGAVYAPTAVSDGEITIANSVSKAYIGLAYTYKLQPLRIVLGGPQGTTQGSITKIAELVLSFYRTLNARYGPDDDELVDINWRTTEDYDSPPALFTGEKMVTLDGGFSTENPIIISGSEPLPCYVRAIIARLEKSGR